MIPGQFDRGRPRALTGKQRKQLHDMDLLIRETQAEIALIFEAAGIDREKRAYHMHRIRREKG